MGMYDTVTVNCPNCGEEHYCQSKSGDCLLRHYTLETCPEDVLANINRHGPNKCDCGISFEIDINTKTIIVTLKD